MKAGVLFETAKTMTRATTRLRIPTGATAEEAAKLTREHAEATAIFGNMDASTRQAVYDRMKDIARNPTTLARTEAPQAIMDMQNALRGYVATP
jgi:hypothetical protein